MEQQRVWSLPCRRCAQGQATVVARRREAKTEGDSDWDIESLECIVEAEGCAPGPEAVCAVEVLRRWLESGAEASDGEADR